MTVVLGERVLSALDVIGSLSASETVVSEGVIWSVTGVGVVGGIVVGSVP